MSENVDSTQAPRKIGPPLSRISRLFESKQLGWVALGGALLAPFVTATPYSLNVMTTAAIFVLLASGLNIVVGYCGLLDLGYIAFMAVGAYTAGILSKSFDLPLIFTIPAVLVMTILAGLIIGAPTLRLRSDYLAIVTLGFGEITRITANNLTITGGPAGNGQVVGRDARDLTETQGDDCQIVTAQPQRRSADDQPSQDRHDQHRGNREDQRQVEALGENTCGVGTNRHERDVSEVKQAAVAHHDVEPGREQHKDRRRGHHVE